MNHTQEIRDEVMLQLYGATAALSRTPENIQKQARRAGHDYTVEEVKASLVMLQDDGLVTTEEDTITGQVRYRITADGVKAWEKSR